MKSNIHSLDSALEEIIDDSVLAITANNQMAKQGTILLTIHSEDGFTLSKKIAQIDTVLVRGIPAQIMFEKSRYGISTLDSTLIYLEEDVDAIPENCSEVSGKTLEEGLEDFQHHFIEFAAERAVDEKQAALNRTGDHTDTALLRQCAESQNPDELFESPYGDSRIKIYTIHGYEYALYFDGGKYESYKCTTTSPTMSEELDDSDCWQRKATQEGQISSTV